MKHFIQLLLLVITSNLYAQDQITETWFSGVIKDQVSNKNIEFGALKNIKTGKVALTDENGKFFIRGSVGDTLKFHSLGYKDTTWVIPGIWLSMEDTIRLNVAAGNYTLGEVEVLRFYSYAHFKQVIKQMALTVESEKEKVSNMVASWDFSKEIKTGKALNKYQQGTLGVSARFGGKGKYDRQREKLREQLKVEEHSERFKYLTSHENVMSLTGYKGACLDSFMIFLRTQYVLDYKMDDIQLLTLISNAADDFKELKQSCEWFHINDSIQ